MTKRCKVGDHNNRLKSQNPETPKKKKSCASHKQCTPKIFENNLNELENCFADSQSKRYSCDCCQKDISTQAKIRCAICDELYICLGCFSVGAETKSHKYWHDYRIVEYLHVPLFCKQWGADEEILLLEGLEMYGMGNWADISSHVCTKSSIECKEHYSKYYLNSTVPIENLFDAVVLDKKNVEYINSAQFQKTNAPPVACPPAPKAATIKINPAHKKPDYLCGYLPIRDEFEIEWDMSCEDNIASMQFDSCDDSSDEEMKLSLLEIYNTRLEKRRQIKRFVVEHKLHNFKYQTRVNRQRTKKHREIYNKMKKFLQIMNNEQYEELVQDLVAEKELEARVIELQEYRKAGYSTFEEVNNSLQSRDQQHVSSYKSPLKASESRGEITSKSPESRASTRLHEKQQKQLQQQKQLKLQQKQQQQQERVLRQHAQQQQQQQKQKLEQQQLFQYYIDDSIEEEDCPEPEPQPHHKPPQHKQPQHKQPHYKQPTHAKRPQQESYKIEIDISHSHNDDDEEDDDEPAPSEGVRTSSRIQLKRQQQMIAQQKKQQQQEMRKQKQREQREQEIEIEIELELEREQMYIERERQEREKQEREREEREEREQQQERERQERERIEQERLEKERIEQERIEEERIEEERKKRREEQQEIEHQVIQQVIQQEAEQLQQLHYLQQLEGDQSDLPPRPTILLQPSNLIKRQQLKQKLKQKQFQRRPLVVQQRQQQHEQTLQRESQRQRQKQHQRSKHQYPREKSAYPSPRIPFFCYYDEYKALTLY